MFLAIDDISGVLDPVRSCLARLGIHVSVGVFSVTYRHTMWGCSAVLRTIAGRLLIPTAT
jgi:hypothetical protein